MNRSERIVLVVLVLLLLLGLLFWRTTSGRKSNELLPPPDVTVSSPNVVMPSSITVQSAQPKTGFVYPRVLIKALPVFSAPDPFAVVRKGEVLTVFFISMEENGRGGRFRVITNLDDAMAKSFRIDPSTPGIEISELTPQL